MHYDYSNRLSYSRCKQASVSSLDIPTMFDMLISDELQIGRNGIELVVIVTFNEPRTIYKVFVVDGTGYTCFTRKRASGSVVGR